MNPDDELRQKLFDHDGSLLTDMLKPLKALGSCLLSLADQLLKTDVPEEYKEINDERN
jgi:hypothetical protein